MRFSSTRNPALRASLARAAVEGFPRDGGLFVPAEEPDLRGLILNLDRSVSFREMASLTASALFGEDLDPGQAARIAERAYVFAPGIIELDESCSLLDLSTGPSGSFKDFGMALLAALLSADPEPGERTVLLATTGDTGAAAAEALRTVEAVRLVLLYPGGAGGGVRPELLARNGGFVETVRMPCGLQDCRVMVREAFERSGRELDLVPATSANIVRLVAQVFYYLWAFIRLRDRNPGEFLVSVPAGNLGNLISGLYAWRWGVPISGFILTGPEGDRSSDGLIRYLFEPVPETAPYDADDPENRERIRALAAGDPEVLRTLIYPAAVDAVSEEAARLRLEKGFSAEASPETARSLAASERFLTEHRQRGSAQTIVLADRKPAAAGSPDAGFFDAELAAGTASLEAYLRG